MPQDCDSDGPQTPFAFGKNWASYAKLVTKPQIDEAVSGLRRLVGPDLTGKRFIDIGCGSGLHALAALRLGASEVVAVDVDKDSVSTARSMLQGHADHANWQVLERSVFDLDSKSMGLFDIVYSWGVLHHTGDMNRAIRMAANLVAPNGMFAFALYRQTRLCWFWKWEKRWYSRAEAQTQAAVRAFYVWLFKIVFALTGRSFKTYVSNYISKRGMDFYHDVHDWLGGWPYESISASDVGTLMRELKMREVRKFTRPGISTGIFGSGCDEYVYTPIAG